MILFWSWEANFLGKAFNRAEELQLTTFKGLILMYLFLVSLLELKHFRASNTFNFFFLSSGGFYVILWEPRDYWNTLKSALSCHLGASVLAGITAPSFCIAFPCNRHWSAIKGTLSNVLALFVLVFLHCGSLGLAATGILATIESEYIPKRRWIDWAQQTWRRINQSRLALRRFLRIFKTRRCIKITSVV